MNEHDLMLIQRGKEPENEPRPVVARGSDDITEADLIEIQEEVKQAGVEEDQKQSSEPITEYDLMTDDEMRDDRAATSIMGNAMGYTNTGMQMGMHPGAAPPRGYVEAETQAYKAQISAEEAQNKVDEYNTELRKLRAQKMQLTVSTSSTATAMASALLNVGVSGPNPEAAKKLVGKDDKKVQARMEEIDQQIAHLQHEAEPFRVELKKAKDAMYGELFKGKDGLMSAPEAARKVRESQESLSKSREGLEKKKGELFEEAMRRARTKGEQWDRGTASAFSKELEEITETMDSLDMLRNHLDYSYRDVYADTESGIQGSYDWSGESEPVGLLEDPIFNLALMYPGIVLGNSFGREATAALTYGTSELVALTGKTVQGASKLGWKGLKVTGKGAGRFGMTAIKGITPTNARAAASILGKGAKTAAKGMPDVAKVSGKALYNSPKTALKYAKNIKLGVGNLLGETKRAQQMNEIFAARHPELVEQGILEEAGKLASGDIDVNEVAAAYTNILKGPRPGKTALDFTVGTKAADKMRKTGFTLKHVFVDRSTAMKSILEKAGEAGKDAIRRFEMQKGTPTYSKLREMKAMAYVNEGLNKDQERMLNRIVFARSEIASEDYLIARSNWDESTLRHMRNNLEETGSQVKHPLGYTRERLESIIDDVELSIMKMYPDEGKDIIAKLHDRADRFFEESRKVLDDLYQEGKVGENIISKEQYESLVKHRGDYAPRLIGELTNEVNYVGMGNRPVSVVGPGWRKAYSTEKGTLLDNRRMLSHMIGNVVERKSRNEATKALFRAAEKLTVTEEQHGSLPPFIRILKKKPQSHLSPTGQKRMRALVEAEEMSEDQYIDLMNELWTTKFEKLGKNETFIGTMIDGEQIGMALDKRFAEQWMKGDPYVAARALDGLQWILGVRPLKMAATMFNPAFAIRNIARDMQHTYMVTQGLYSSFLPQGFAQMAQDYAATIVDAWRWDKTKSKRYMEAMKDGLGMDFLAGSASWKAHGFEHKTSETIAQVFGHVGESSEVWTRLAVRERGIKKYMKAGKSYEEAARLATYDARSMLDFSQHGSMMHVLDAVFPYANASMQAARGSARAAFTNPKEFFLKTGQVMGLHAWWYNQLRQSHSELYDSLSDYERENYMIFPASFLSPKKENGKTRHPYFRIATDQQIRPFTAIAEMIADISTGREIDPWKGVRAAEQMLAIQPDTSAMPPLIQAVTKYGANYDFWRRQEIWRGQEVHPHLEQNKWTSPLAVDVGEATGLSPARLESATEAYTANNFWLDTLGLGAAKMKAHISDKQKEKVSEMMINDIPGLNSIIRYSNPNVRIKENYKRLELDSNSFNLKMGGAVTDIVESNEGVGDAIFGLRKYLESNNVPRTEWSNYFKKVKQQMILKNNGLDTREWKDLIYANGSRVKAQILYDKYDRAESGTEKQELLRNASRAGIYTGETKTLFHQIKRNNGELPSGYDYE